jgi:restriction endonuclease NotI
MSSKQARTTKRFGIAEWYGKSFATMSAANRKKFAALQFRENPKLPICPFLSTPDKQVSCWKKGGVCSIRLFERTDGSVRVSPSSTIRTLCPSRFEQDRLIYAWIGEVVLGTANAVAIGQINFLERVPLMGGTDEEGAAHAQREVGRIDNILVVPSSDPLGWCPVEIQAVYFSGPKMEIEFLQIQEHTGNTIPFPVKNRRPDYRSSAPKRLMPQLQIKVPALRRWGKKMAVVVDEDFFKALGRMEVGDDLGNSEVVWFIVKYDESKSGEIRLSRGKHVFTTLESSVAGLVAGRPITLQKFEAKILEKLHGRVF